MVLKKKSRWSGHIFCMSGNRIPKQILYSELEVGKRTIGGQRKGYRYMLLCTLKLCEIDAKKWEAIATDREAWKLAVHEGV